MNDALMDFNRLPCGSYHMRHHHSHYSRCFLVDEQIDPRCSPLFHPHPKLLQSTSKIRPNCITVKYYTPILISRGCDLQLFQFETNTLRVSEGKPLFRLGKCFVSIWLFSLHKVVFTYPHKQEIILHKMQSSQQLTEDNLEDDKLGSGVAFIFD